MTSITQQLAKATGVAAKGDPSEYLASMAKEIGKDSFKDKDWNALDTEAQEYINKVMDAIEADEDVPLPPDADGGKPSKKAKANGKAHGKANGKAKPEKAAKAAKPEKAAKGKKVAAKGEKGEATKRVRGKAFADTAKIKVLVKSPHKDGSAIAERFALIKGGMTVGAARKAGLSMLDLRCDVDRGNLEIK